MRFRDRSQAGELLADRVIDALGPAGGSTEAVEVVALPRGGVPVARPIADRLGGDLRLLLVRKLGLPGHPELAMGAVAAVGDRIRSVANEAVLREHRVDDASWQRVLRFERAELDRRTRLFGAWTVGSGAGTTAIVVDDGLATGATMQAAVAVLRDAGAARIVVAVPVASRAAIAALQRSGADVVALSRPEPMIAVGMAYRDFHQLDDDEVLALLQQG